MGYAMNRMGQGLGLNERGQSLTDVARLSLGYTRQECGSAMTPTRGSLHVARRGVQRVVTPLVGVMHNARIRFFVADSQALSSSN